MNPLLGNPHKSKDPNRGYLEYDPILKINGQKNLKGKHGLMDVRAEIANSSYDAGLMNNSAIKNILKK